MKQIHVNGHAPAHQSSAISMSIQTAQPPLVILRLNQVLKKTGLSRSTIYDKLNPKSPRFDETFRKPIKLGASAIGFIETEIDAWIASRVVGRDHSNLDGGQGA